MKILPKPIAFEWDVGNIDKNWIKHKIKAKEAEEIFKNKFLKIFKDLKHSQKEQRFVAYGTTKSDRKLTVVFTVRMLSIRIISVRIQSKKERKIYEEKN